MTRNVLRMFGFSRTALAVGVGIPLMLAANAFAQDPDATPGATTPTTSNPAAPVAGGASNAPQTGVSAEAERVIVTGSNIPTAEEVGPNPVLNINRDLINKRGERNAEELIRNLPVANANGVPVSNNATGFTSGASSISLRGFDPSATLVLVDGKRIAVYPIGTGGTFSFVDLFSIPKAAIDSIEILKDGASTTYGADAVAGVVNIKLRHNYRGAEATIEYGNTLDKDAGEFSADLIFGVGDDKTQVTGTMNYYHHNSVFNHDRGFSARPPFLSSNASPENLQLTRAGVLPALGLPADPFPNINPASNPTLFDFFTDGRSPQLNATGLALIGSGGTGVNDAANLAMIDNRPKLVAVNSGAGFQVNNTFFGSAPLFTNGLAPASRLPLYLGPQPNVQLQLHIRFISRIRALGRLRQRRA